MAKSSGSFKKGQSGNPKGRPPAVPHEVKELCRAHTVEAVEIIVGVMRSKKENGATRVAAANSLIDRGWGKATQPLGNDDGVPFKVVIERYGDSPASE
jgi:hypothetical protein